METLRHPGRAHECANSAAALVAPPAGIVQHKRHCSDGECRTRYKQITGASCQSTSMPPCHCTTADLLSYHCEPVLHHVREATLFRWEIYDLRKVSVLPCHQ